MKITEKYDKVLTGVISGLLLPVIIALFIFLFARGDPSLHEWLKRVSMAEIDTHIIYLSVFPNFLIFLLYNHFDMLRALRGVLGITIVWAVVVFLIKIL